MEVRVYDVFWKNLLIGTLYVNGRGKYKYLINKENVQIARVDGLVNILLLKEQRKFGEPIPIFKSRIEDNWKDFPDINYRTDFLKLSKRE